MSSRNYSWFAMLLASLALACGPEVSEPPPPAQPPANDTPALTTKSWEGYSHTPGKSGFPLGEHVTTFEEAGVSKVSGDNGVFAIDLVNGAATAVPNATAPVLQVPPLGPADAHNARARSYFEAAGIVSEQIAAVHVNTMMAGSGPADAPPTQGQLVAYYSLLDRGVDGIPLPDSVAWVRFNANDEVVSEAVYWPTIPSQVVAEAKALKETLAAPATAASYKAKLPSGLQSGTVVVRHTDSTWRKAFAAYAVYDVVDGSNVRHFSPSGDEIKLANEVP